MKMSKNARTSHAVCLVLLMSAMLWSGGCGATSGGTDAVSGDAAGGADIGTDTDSGVDTLKDPDADSDSISDVDVGTEADADVGTDVDTDVGTDVDSDADVGAPSVTVPDLVGKLLATAETDILEAGLTVGAVTEQHSEAAPEGHVISQDPVAGEGVAEGSPVALVVSMGPEEIPYDGPRPGEFSPLQNPQHRILFRDDEVMLLSGRQGNPDIDYAMWSPDNEGLTSWSSAEETLSQTSGEDIGSEIAVASGRLLGPDHDQVVYAYYRPDGWIHVRIVEDGVTVDEHLFDFPESPSWRSIDLAVGDLDLLVDEDGLYHDEIVLLFTHTFPESDVTVGMLVLDSSLEILAGTGIEVGAWAAALALGDFDGDESLEIAVGISKSQGSNNNHHTAFRLTMDELGEYSLVQGPLTSFPCQFTGMDLAAGDFDGDGVDEVALCEGRGWRIRTYRINGDLEWSQQDSFALNVNQVVDASIVAGLFVFDPASGRGIHRRQLAVSQTRDFSNTTDLVKVSLLEANGNLDLSHLVYPTEFFGDTSPPQWGFIDVGHATLAAGNFTGHLGTNTAPTMDLMLSFTNIIHEMNSADQSRQWLKCLRLENNDTLSELFSWSGAAETCDDIPSAVVAYDGDGDAYVLGAPAHIVMQDLLKVDYIIQEPPKHLDYLPDDPQDPDGPWSVVKVSARQDFYVELTDSSEQTMETTTKSRSSWGLGGSLAVSSANTVSFGTGDIAKVSASLDTTLKIGYDYDERKSTWDSEYTSHKLSQTVSTIADDYVDGELQLIDVWRYRVHGLTSEDPDMSVYQDIVIPGPTVTFSASTGLGNSDWYQPVHLNNNILSYPASSSFVPTDLGWFHIPGEEEPIQELMNDGATNYTWGGVSQTIDIAWTETAGSGSEKSYDHKLSESLDIAVGVSGKANSGLVSGSTSVGVKLNIHSNQSWGASEIASNKNSNTTGIRMVVPYYPDPTTTYTFKTAVYSAGNGTFKVAHATDPLGTTSGAAWWAGQYGRAHDLALNLPFRFVFHSGVPTAYYTLAGDPEPQGDETPEETAARVASENRTRKLMRGCYLRETEVNPDTGEKDLFGGVLKDGDVVEVVVRVYNFSLKTGETPEFDVLFEYIAVDPVTLEEIGERQTIGTVSTTLGPTDVTPHICQSPMKEVAIEWDTAGLGGHTMRIYVTVDPTDTVADELHEWKVDGEKIPNGNNEGYWPWGTELPVLSTAE